MIVKICKKKYFLKESDFLELPLEEDFTKESDDLHAAM